MFKRTQQPDGGQTQKMNDNGGGGNDQEVEFTDFSGVMSDISARVQETKENSEDALRQERLNRRQQEIYRGCVC